MGDDTNTLFWCDPWLDGGHPKDRFSRFFTLADNKMMIVVYMFSLGWGRVVRLENGDDVCWLGRNKS